MNFEEDYPDSMWFCNGCNKHEYVTPRKECWIGHKGSILTFAGEVEKYCVSKQSVREAKEKIKKELWNHPGRFEGIKCKTCLPLDWVEIILDEVLGRLEK